MKRFFFLFAFVLLVLPRMVGAASDVAVLDDMSFSTDTFIVGDTVRVYVSLRNTGDTDIRGNVAFYIGTEQVGGLYEISIPKDGQKEEVFTDFVVPTGDFNVRVEISNISPADTNTANNEILSGIITVVQDIDGDGVPDPSDNCVTRANVDQRDTDHDGIGNVCDDDIDGDGWSNDKETQMKTDPLSPDTDGDGIVDPLDPTPLGEPLVVPKPVEKKTEPVVPATVTTVPESSPEQVSVSETSASETSIDETQVAMEASDEARDIEETTEIVEEVQSSENALFTFEEVRWGTYAFRVVGPSVNDGARYAWDFGDGITSSRREVTHYYGASGRFEVKLSVTDPDAKIRTDSAEVLIPFFDFANRSVRMLLVFLVVLLLIGISVLYRLGEIPSPTTSPVAKRRNTKTKSKKE